MHQPSKFSKRFDEFYLVTWFKEPYSLFAAMLCRLYGLPNCSVFKTEWAPVAHHVLATGDYFPWASMLSLELKISIQEYQKATARKKPKFFFSAFIYDILCVEFEYPNLGWKWSFLAPPMPIYYSELWDTNYAPRFYDICQHFLGTIYFLIFKTTSWLTNESWILDFILLLLDLLSFCTMMQSNG